MSGWDEGTVTSLDLGLSKDGDNSMMAPSDQPELSDLDQLQSKFRQFLRTFRQEEEFIYRDQLVANYNQGNYFVEVDVRDLETFDAQLMDALRLQPANLLPRLEEAAREVVHMSLVDPSPVKDLEPIQITLRNYHRYNDLRRLEAKNVSQLVAVRGIVVTGGKVRIKATVLNLRCRGCNNVRKVTVNPGFGGARIPRNCDAQQLEGAVKCPLDPYMVLPDTSKYIDQQRIKLQEAPENVPTGEMPRNLALSLEKYQAGVIKPGTRVNVVGIYSIFEGQGSNRDGKGAVAIRHPYLRVLGISSETESSELLAGNFRPEDEEEMHELAKSRNVYEKVTKSIAPQIFGSDDIKKAIAVMLLGGSRKQLPDGMRIRGDINVLLLGDPSTAKSQFLKFASQLAPIGVYTSGKGSSAAGLTASVIRDASSGEFQLEGGALVLADGGLVCIDEFDKMREQDRVAIHEAMEQQTISIAKAGITTILNSRTSVLAAANPVFGRYDDMKTPTENIEFQSTILSRFDLIFIVRDIRNEKRDQELAKYVISVHQRKDVIDGSDLAADIDTEKLKKYIAFARAKCSPRVSAEAAELLKSKYVSIRKEMRSQSGSGGDRVIPITVRQLEAIVRISEGLAKMELSPVANVSHVREAIRLFEVSTLSAAQSEVLKEGVGSKFNESVRKAEKQIKRRLAIGSRIRTAGLVSELSGAQFSNLAVQQALDMMRMRGDVAFEQQRSFVRRVK